MDLLTAQLNGRNWFLGEATAQDARIQALRKETGADPSNLMLTCTFRHFKGIGAKTERELWRSGILSWEAFESRHAVQLSMFSVDIEDEEVAQVWDSKKAFDVEDADYFARGLPRQEHYRIALS